MKVLLAFLGLAFISNGLLADEIKTQVLEIGLTKNSEAMVFTETEGRVLWANGKDKRLLGALQKARNEKRELFISYDADSGRIHGVQLLETSSEDFQVKLLEEPKASYTPSVISLEEAQSIFPTLMKKKRWRSQCYNRAHVWSYDMWRFHNVRSMKMFIFFTKRFIEEHRYKWWFHVAPLVVVKTENGTEEMLMDRTFMDGPEKVKNWTDYFVRTRPHCPVVTNYSEYRDNQYAHDCYLIKESMYYYSPRDLDHLETRREQKLDWDFEQLEYARKQAFKN